MNEIKKIIIPKHGNFELPAEYQGLSRVHLVMPFSTSIFYPKTINRYFRNPEKDEPYCKNGYLLINGIEYMTVDEKGNQKFWETHEINSDGTPKDDRKTKVVPKGQKTLI